MYKKIRIALLFAVLLAGLSPRGTRAMKEFVGGALITGGLLFAGAVGIWTYYAGTPARELLSAASAGDLDRVKQLIKAGVSVNIQGSGSNTALHMAVFGGHVAVARYLIAQGADVFIKNSTGSTPLHLAVFARELGLIKCLMQAGADSTVQDALGKTPVQLLNGQTGVFDQKIRDYLALGTDFYRVVGGTLTFAEFAKKHFDIQDGIAAKNNRVNFCGLLHLGPKELADQFYDWLKKSPVKSDWLKDRVCMYLDLMGQSRDVSKKIYWRTICCETKYSWDLSEKVTKKLYRELDKPDNSLFKKQCAHQVCSENMRTLSKNLIKPDGKKPGFGTDLKIEFKK